MIASLLQDFAVGVKSVTCVLNCLLHICEEDVVCFISLSTFCLGLDGVSHVAKYFDYLTKIGNHVVSPSVHFH